MASGGDGGFFTGIYGSKPDPIGMFNKTGPKPPSHWSGQGVMAGPGGQFNASGGALLGSVNPYDSDPSFSSETAYLNIPNSIPKVIPTLKNIPDGSTPNVMSLSHCVSYGGISFAMKIPMPLHSEYINEYKQIQRTGMASEAYINLATVNYFLHGIQRYYTGNDYITGRNPTKTWNTFIRAMNIPTTLLPDDVYDVNAEEGKQHTKDNKLRLAQWIYQHWLRPFGVVHASDKQGGQHQKNSGPIATWPVDYVTTQVVDGKVQNMTNIWRHKDIGAGDDLILRLCFVKNVVDYTLVGYPACYTRKSFSPWNNGEDNGVWQLVPDIFDTAPDINRRSPIAEDTETFNYRYEGYWHIARSHAFWGHMPNTVGVGNDDSAHASGALLEATFSPAFIHEEVGDCDTDFNMIEEVNLYSDMQSSKEEDDKLEESCQDSIDEINTMTEDFMKGVSEKLSDTRNPVFVRNRFRHTRTQGLNDFELYELLKGSRDDFFSGMKEHLKSFTKNTELYTKTMSQIKEIKGRFFAALNNNKNGKKIGYKSILPNLEQNLRAYAKVVGLFTEIDATDQTEIKKLSGVDPDGPFTSFDMDALNKQSSQNWLGMMRVIIKEVFVDDDSCYQRDHRIVKMDDEWYKQVMDDNYVLHVKPFILMKYNIPELEIQCGDTKNKLDDAKNASKSAPADKKKEIEMLEAKVGHHEAIVAMLEKQLDLTNGKLKYCTPFENIETLKAKKQDFQEKLDDVIAGLALTRGELEGARKSISSTFAAPMSTSAPTSAVLSQYTPFAAPMSTSAPTPAPAPAPAPAGDNDTIASANTHIRQRKKKDPPSSIVLPL